MRKLRRRLTPTQEQEIHDPEVKTIKVYPKQRCAVEGCERWAVGSGDVCKKHGGTSLIRDNLMLYSELPSTVALQTVFKPGKHPIEYIEFSRNGMSDVEIAAEFGISVYTLREWSEKYLEFNTAFEVGKALHEAWWLQEGKNNLDNRSYNVGLYKFLTGNKLGYSDKIESKNLHVHAGVLQVPSTMNKEEWEQACGRVSKKEV